VEADSDADRHHDRNKYADLDTNAYGYSHADCNAE
jgi:hypothetical protein